MRNKINIGMCRKIAWVTVVFLIIATVQPASGVIITSAEQLNEDPGTYIQIMYLKLKESKEPGKIVLLENPKKLNDISGCQEKLYVIGHVDEKGFDGLTIEKFAEKLKEMKLKQAIIQGKIESIHLLYCGAAEKGVVSKKSDIEVLSEIFKVSVTGYPGDVGLCRPGVHDEVKELKDAIMSVGKTTNTNVYNKIFDKIIADWDNFVKSVEAKSDTTSKEVYNNAGLTWEKFKTDYLKLINLNNLGRGSITVKQ